MTEAKDVIRNKELGLTAQTTLALTDAQVVQARCGFDETI
jgi:hypothetical protein